MLARAYGGRFEFWRENEFVDHDDARDGSFSNLERKGKAVLIGLWTDAVCVCRSKSPLRIVN
jgi:hypothetical protein